MGSGAVSHYRIQERPNMPGVDGGDAIIFGHGLGNYPYDYVRLKSWQEAWAWLGGNTEPGDTVEVLEVDPCTAPQQ